MILTSDFFKEYTGDVMIRLNWLPWKFVIRKLAKKHGILDPVRLISRIDKFAQPSEVVAPMELVRASIVLHARGLINARTIQTNLDWLWPYWVQRQFNPKDEAFVPRSYTLTHVNLTNRNWTAIGMPDCSIYPILDARGLITPFFDGWSLDVWILDNDGEGLFPSLENKASQRLYLENDTLAVETTLKKNGMQIISRADVFPEDQKPVCRIHYRVISSVPAVFAVALRPFNPEGVSFIHDIILTDRRKTWKINDEKCVFFSRPVSRHYVSSFLEGDVIRFMRDRPEKNHIHCNVGMASATAVYHMKPNVEETLEVKVDLCADPETEEIFPSPFPDVSWKNALANVCPLEIPDERIQFLYNAAVWSVVLHSPLDVYPGPFYYKRFWFRDAVFILYAMICIGLHERSRRLLDRFSSRQTLEGYFHSQQGEWDSNGQVMWIFERFAAMTGEGMKEDWIDSVIKAGKWIEKKRTPVNSDALHAGLMPAGFSAEHLGNNDFYYWDNFWSIAGLMAGSKIISPSGHKKMAALFEAVAESMKKSVEISLLKSRHIRHYDGIPASPYRRLDAGAIGSVVGAYPLRILPANDPRLTATVEFLFKHCFIDHAFFQDMFHSGYNIYLSLHCAQVLLRSSNPAFMPIVQRVAELASPTGQWPEAIHPRTLGGCQGDGQHIWAAAEWIMMIRNMFVREENEELILFSGIDPDWIENGKTVTFGVAHTEFGTISLYARGKEKTVTAGWKADWRKEPTRVIFAIPGYRIQTFSPLPENETKIKKQCVKTPDKEYLAGKI